MGKATVVAGGALPPKSDGKSPLAAQFHAILKSKLSLAVGREPKLNRETVRSAVVVSRRLRLLLGP